jgi:hypothetical protein
VRIQAKPMHGKYSGANSAPGSAIQFNPFFFFFLIKRLSTPTIGIVVHGILGKKDEYGAGGMEKKKNNIFPEVLFH